MHFFHHARCSLSDESRQAGPHSALPTRRRRCSARRRPPPSPLYPAAPSQPHPLSSPAPACCLCPCPPVPSLSSSAALCRRSERQTCLCPSATPPRSLPLSSPLIQQSTAVHTAWTGQQRTRQHRTATVPRLQRGSLPSAAHSTGQSSAGAKRETRRTESKQHDETSRRRRFSETAMHACSLCARSSLWQALSAP